MTVEHHNNRATVNGKTGHLKGEFEPDSSGWGGLGFVLLLPFFWLYIVLTEGDPPPVPEDPPAIVQPAQPSTGPNCTGTLC